MRQRRLHEMRRQTCVVYSEEPQRKQPPARTGASYCLWGGRYLAAQCAEVCTIGRTVRVKFFAVVELPLVRRPRPVGIDFTRIDSDSLPPAR